MLFIFQDLRLQIYEKKGNVKKKKEKVKGKHTKQRRQDMATMYETFCKLNDTCVEGRSNKAAASNAYGR